MRKDEDYRRSMAAIEELGLEIDLMRPPSSFALRTTHEFKQAAVAISKSSFYEWDENTHLTVRAWGGGSINSVFNALLRHGLKHIRPHLVAEIASAEAERRPFVQMAQHLLNMSEAKGVRASDFAEDSEARNLLAAIHADNDLSANAFTFDRADVMDELSMVDRRLDKLRDALAAIDSALATPL